MLVSAVWQSDSTICKHIVPPSLISLPPQPQPRHLGHHRALSWAPCTLYQLLTSYLFYTRQSIYVNPNPPLCPTLPFPLGISFTKPLISFMATLVVKNLPAKAGNIKNVGSLLDWEDPLEQGMATHSSILAWELHGQRSLVGYSPWGWEELDTTDGQGGLACCDSDTTQRLNWTELKCLSRHAQSHSWGLHLMTWSPCKGPTS